MGAIQEWSSGIKTEMGPNLNQDLTDELFLRIKENISSTNPDFADCIASLASFAPSVFEKFYSATYVDLDKRIQQQWNQAVLSWADAPVSDKSKKVIVYPRIILVIQSRLPQVNDPDEISCEMQWCIAHFGGNPKKVKAIEAMRNKTPWEHLKKLLYLNVEGWPVDKDNLLNFYFVLFPDSEFNYEKEELLSFLDRNHLNKPDAPITSKKDKNQSTIEKFYEIKSGVSEQKIVSQSDNDEAQHDDATKMIGQDSGAQHDAKTALATQTTEASDVQTQTISKTDTNQPAVVGSWNVESQTAFSMVPKQENPEPLENYRRAKKSESKEQDGLKMLRRALTWAEQQSQEMEELKENLTKSESRIRLLEAEKAALEHRLQDAMSEASALRIQLANAENQVNEEREKYQNLDNTVEALHHMNENTELQAISGFKADLASAVQSIVHDARLPEAQGNAEILSALLEDLLDTMRFKGIPMEED